MHSRQRSPSGIGSAHEAHLDDLIAGSEAQQSAQHDAVRARHGSSPSQTTQAACRTIRAVSRPNNDSVCNTTQLYFGRSRFR
jgi:hypothetical protein